MTDELLKHFKRRVEELESQVKDQGKVIRKSAEESLIINSIFQFCRSYMLGNDFDNAFLNKKFILDLKEKIKAYDKS